MKKIFLAFAIFGIYFMQASESQIEQKLLNENSKSEAHLIEKKPTFTLTLEYHTDYCVCCDERHYCCLCYHNNCRQQLVVMQVSVFGHKDQFNIHITELKIAIKQNLNKLGYYTPLFNPEIKILDIHRNELNDNIDLRIHKNFIIIHVSSKKSIEPVMRR